MSATPGYAIWDPVVRGIHWFFPIAVGLLWWTGENQWFDWHSRVGYAVLVVVLTRFLWGLIGSHYARFTVFLRSPIAVWRYLRQGAFDGVGHNPIGGWSTLLLLTLLLIQAITGLFAYDDMLFEGPLSYWAGNLADPLTQWHEINWLLLQVVILLHIAAIAIYQFRGQKLVQRMWRGRLDEQSSPHAPVASRWAIVALTMFSIALATIIAIAPEAPSYY